MMTASPVSGTIDLGSLKQVSLQLSYSTADIERSIFFDSSLAPSGPSESVQDAIILVVNGDLFVLEDREIARPSLPLTEQSGLFDVAGMRRSID